MVLVHNTRFREHYRVSLDNISCLFTDSFTGNVSLTIVPSILLHKRHAWATTLCYYYIPDHHNFIVRLLRIFRIRVVVKLIWHLGLLSTFFILINGRKHTCRTRSSTILRSCSRCWCLRVNRVGSGFSLSFLDLTLDQSFLLRGSTVSEEYNTTSRLLRISDIHPNYGRIISPS